MVGTIKRHFAEKAASSKLELLDKVPMFGVLTDAHKQLLAGALELVSTCALVAATGRMGCVVRAQGGGALQITCSQTRTSSCWRVC